jgi:hypothetical protein
MQGVMAKGYTKIGHIHASTHSISTCIQILIQEHGISTDTTCTHTHISLFVQIHHAICYSIERRLVSKVYTSHTSVSTYNIQRNR